MNSLFASNFIYSFQIFALTLFLVIHTEFAERGFNSAKRLVPFVYSISLFNLLIVAPAGISPRRRNPKEAP